jgi:OOP family OmpA-OmpF porin
LIALCFNAWAQNLVPNYSFEKYDSCVNGIDEYDGYVSNWIGQEGSGALGWFTSQCADTLPKNQSAGVPYNFCGFQYAHSGVSYTQLSTFVNGSPNQGDSIYPYGHNVFFNARNYIETTLIDSLQKGVTYYVAFFMSLGDSSVYACSDIGAYFSTTQVPMSGSLVLSSFIPQVANNPKKQELTDKINWMKVSGSFVSKGGEKYITIGNFKNDSLSSIRYLGPDNPAYTAAYYYIDDVIVSPDSTTSINEINASSKDVGVFPNPSNGKFDIKTENINTEVEINIYNSLGQKIFTQTSIPNSQFSIDISTQYTGIYFYRITEMKGALVKTGKVIVIH